MKTFIKKNLIKNNLYLISLLVIIFMGFFVRTYGLDQNYSFWTDEASTGRFSRAILKTGLPKITENGYFLGVYSVTHYLTALSFLVFGVNEFAARLPEVFFGTLLIPVVYFIGKKLFNAKIGLSSAALTAFSFIQIAWSRQARGYTIFEVFFLIAIYFLYAFSEEKKIKHLIALFVFSLLSVLTHSLGLILIPIILVCLLLNFKKNLLRSLPFILIPIIIGVLFRNYLVPHLNTILPKLLKGENYLSYYHSLFWRQYPVITFLSLIGLLHLFSEKKNKIFLLFLSAISIYLFFASFLLHVPFEKYVLTVFPLIFLLSSSALFFISGKLLIKIKKTKLTQLLLNKEGFIKQELLLALLTLFIIGNGNKFSLKPRKFYSLNFDMREIPEINYKGIYDLIKSKIGDIPLGQIAFVDIDSDIASFYVGEEAKKFIPRNDFKDQDFYDYAGGKIVHSLGEFKDLEKEYQKGFVVLVEHNFRFYPEDLVDYARKNLNLEKKENLAYFSPDWNYWPVEVYSWGFEK